MESLFLIILVFFIILIIFPFSFNIDIGYDINLNDGYFVIKLWKIKLHKSTIKRKGRNIILIKNRNNKDFEIEINEKQIKFIFLFLNELKNKIKIRKIELKSEIGVADPLYSSIFSGIFSSIILTLFARLKIKQPTASFKLNNRTKFFEFIFDTSAFLKVSISIFDVLYSLVTTILKSKNDKLIEKKLRKI